MSGDILSSLKLMSTFLIIQNQYFFVFWAYTAIEEITNFYGGKFNLLFFKFFFKEIFCPQDTIGLLRSNLGILLLRKFGIVWVYIDLPGVVIWQHIHPSTLHLYWEEDWQDSSCLRDSLNFIRWNLLFINT